MKRTKTTGKRCTKIQYTTRREALNALATMKKEGRIVATDALGAYQCSRCPGRKFHLGNKV